MLAADPYAYSFDLTLNDYRQFYAAIGRYQGKPSKWIYPGAISVSLPVAAVLAYFTPYNLFDVGVSCVLAFVLGMVTMVVVLRIAHVGAIRRLAAIGAEDWIHLSVTLDDHVVEARGDGIAIQGSWSAVKDVTIENGALLIWLGRLQAVPIPERAFASTAERDAVMAFARSRMAP
jgi:hypothetical protein